uniref:Gellan lyase (Fragments) n=1 Tax=Geobacillus stearothermophilus TaxID=1422 RepID=GELL_GEOSE|nr:RecName: Full=Gellan lyase [Geobacillus stearothermophilus]
LVSESNPGRAIPAGGKGATIRAARPGLATTLNGPKAGNGTTGATKLTTPARPLSEGANMMCDHRAGGNAAISGSSVGEGTARAGDSKVMSRMLSPKGSIIAGTVNMMPADIAAGSVRTPSSLPPDGRSATPMSVSEVASDISHKDGSVNVTKDPVTAAGLTAMRKNANKGSPPASPLPLKADNKGVHINKHWVDLKNDNDFNTR